MRNSQLAFLNSKILTHKLKLATRKFQLATRKINSHAKNRNSQILTRKINSQATTRNSLNYQLATRNPQLEDYPNPVISCSEIEKIYQSKEC